MALKAATKKKKPREPMINIKASLKQKRALQARADAYANGNLSLWLRYAGMRYKPSQEELETT